ncbi:M23 family metallopeptidase [Kocuria sp.]|uniref:M23 family metallopeptidase n=1 Tax=Kocuria sp. TaxID=1871328 RepID=UPI0034D01BB6
MKTTSRFVRDWMALSLVPVLLVVAAGLLAVTAPPSSWLAQPATAAPPPNTPASLTTASGSVESALLAVPPRAPARSGQEAALAKHRGQWESPTGGAPRVAKDFQPPAKRWLSGHRGVDLTVAWDGRVYAPADGTVSHVGTVVDRNTITIDHGDGLRSSFEPVDSDLKRGERVRKGQLIGILENGNHCMFSIRACVHWGVRLGDDYVNPLQFIGAFLPSVLLPVP